MSGTRLEVNHSKVSELPGRNQSTLSDDPLVPSRSIGAFEEAPDESDSGEEAYVYFHIDPKHTNFVNRIIEGYEYVGVMTSVDNEGLCMVRCTPSTRSLAIDILQSLPEYVTIEG